MTARRGGSGVRLDVMLTAEIPTPRGYAFRAEGSLLSRLRAGLATRGPTFQSACLAYVIRHPHAGVILVDTGLHPDAASNLGKDFGLPMSLLFRDIQPAAAPFDVQLRSLDVEPAEVERVVMTHLHVDHTSGMRLLPNASFVCSREEWSAARERFAARNGYVAHHLPHASRVELLDFEHDAERYGAFGSTIDLLGDGSVRLISTPGHTRGHLSVLLRLEDGRTGLLVGDAAYTQRNIREQLLPMITAVDTASRNSLRELKAFWNDEPQAVVVPSHDPDAWRQLRDVDASMNGSPASAAIESSSDHPPAVD